MSFGRAALLELEKLAKDDADPLERLLAACRERGLSTDSTAFKAICKDVTGQTSTDDLSDEELDKVYQAVMRFRRHGPLPKPLKAHKGKAGKSDIVRAANRKKMLLGVKREKAILKIDIMKRINKKLRLANRPFLKLKKQQRKMRIGMVQDTRNLARKSYRR